MSRELLTPRWRPNMARLSVDWKSLVSQPVVFRAHLGDEFALWDWQLRGARERWTQQFWEPYQVIVTRLYEHNQHTWHPTENPSTSCQTSCSAWSAKWLLPRKHLCRLFNFVSQSGFSPNILTCKHDPHWSRSSCTEIVRRDRQTRQEQDAHS